MKKVRNTLRNAKRLNAQNSIAPANLTAQLSYRGAGNPPSTHPSSAISNCFPGLEMDFRNAWRNIFEGIVLHESNNLVVKVEAKPFKRLKGLFLTKVNGESMTTDVTGPDSNGRNGVLASDSALEWSNALAAILLKKQGKIVNCEFRNSAGRAAGKAKLKVRNFFEQNGQGKENKTVVISQGLAGPGDLTQSLCSPWQNDYRECACYYWAASRPDYINVEPGPDGRSRGHNWLAKQRNEKNKTYLNDQGSNTDRLVSYIDLFADWERALRFIIGGKEEKWEP